MMYCAESWKGTENPTRVVEEASEVCMSLLQGQAEHFSSILGTSNVSCRANGS